MVLLVALGLWFAGAAVVAWPDAQFSAVVFTIGSLVSFYRAGVNGLVVKAVTDADS